MSYENADIETIALGALTLTSAVIRDIEPKNADERIGLYDVLYKVDTTFAGATTTPGFKAGSSSSDALLVDAFDFGLLGNSNVIQSMRKNFPSKFNDPQQYGAAVLPKGATLRATLSAATGAGAAGVAQVWLQIKRF